jgi:hypothetical protein
MWKLGLDFGSSVSRPSTKTPLFQLLTSTSFCLDTWRGAQDAGGRNSCNSKYVRTDQEDFARLIWRHKPRHPGPLGFSRKPTPDELNSTFIECHRRIQVFRATAGCWYPRYYVPYPQNSASDGSSMSNDRASQKEAF